MTTSHADTRTPSDAEQEVVGLLQELLRIPSVNTGDPATIGDGEARAARYIQGKLEEVGFETQYAEAVPGRGNVVCRLRGADPSRGALLIHGHVDVVPADADEWQVDPFGGIVKDGYVWGRGAVDMKDMVAMSLAVARDFKRRDVVPPRDLIFAFVSDEEAGGFLGAGWLVDHHPEWFDGATEAVSEVGGFSVTLDNFERAYLVAPAEKAVAWANLTAHGRAGHGSMVNEDNAVTRIAAAVARLGEHEFPVHRIATIDAFLKAITTITGHEFPDEDFEGSIAKLGPISRLVLATIRNTANPTMLDAGYKANVIPSVAKATVDCRVLPGTEAEFKAEVQRLVGDDIDVEWLESPALEAPFDVPLVDAMRAALQEEDPGSHMVPYVLSGGTDNKAFSRLGIVGYGFSPLRLPPDLDFTALFHGVDERVPIDALTFGTRVLSKFLTSC